MSAQADDTQPEAGKLPTGRLARTARVGGLVTGQGLRWAGMRTANRVRSPERAAAARDERTAALVGELGAPLGEVFSDFDERAFAAASIGQVHRATTLEGDDVVVKVQYPGVAEAVETDLRNAMMLLPLVKRLAPSLDAKALASELRERIVEELDYELEAQNQRRIERLRRGHPFISVPAVNTELSTRRVLVSEYIDGERFGAVRRLDEPQRERYGEIVFRFYF